MDIKRVRLKFVSLTAEFVGMFTSPHLIHVRERFRINGKPLSKTLFTKYFFEVYDALYVLKVRVRIHLSFTSLSFFNLSARLFVAQFLDRESSL